MLRFFLEWGRAVAWAESVGGGIVKVLAIVLAVAGLPAVFDDPVSVFLDIPRLHVIFGREQQWTLGWLLVVMLATVCVLWTGGVAWVRSKGPRLWVAKEITAGVEPDKFPIFRLLVRNDGEGVLEPDATVVVTENGERLHLGESPLLWMYLRSDQKPQLGHRQEHALKIARGSPLGGGLFFFINSHDDFERVITSRDADVEVCIRVRGHRKQIEERRFRVHRDAGMHFVWAAESRPMPLAWTRDLLARRFPRWTTHDR